MSRFNLDGTRFGHGHHFLVLVSTRIVLSSSAIVTRLAILHKLQSTHQSLESVGTSYPTALGRDESPSRRGVIVATIPALAEVGFEFGGEGNFVIGVAIDWFDVRFEFING